MSKQFKYIFIIIFLLFIIFEFSYLYIFPKLINSNVNKIIKIFENKSNVVLNYDKFNFKTKLDFSCSLNIDNLNIKTKQNINILNLEQTNFEFYPLKIIFKIVDLKSLYIKNLKLNISRDKEGFFNFINIPLKSTNLKLKYNNINVNL